MDKKLKYSKASILESNEARARIQWNYACNDVRYRIFHGNTFGEEVYTVYPDGIAVRQLTAFPGDQSAHGGNPNMWQVLEWILVHGVGITPDEIYPKKNAFILGENLFESYFIGDIEINDPHFKCFNSSAGKINFTIEGRGDRTLI